MNERIFACNRDECWLAEFLAVLVVSIFFLSSVTAHAAGMITPTEQDTRPVMRSIDSDLFARYIYQDWSDPVLDQSDDVYHYLRNFSMPMVMYQCTQAGDPFQYQEKFTQAYQEWFPLHITSIRKGRDILLERAVYRKFSLPGYLISWSIRHTDWLYANMEFAMDSPCRDVLYGLYDMTGRARKSSQKNRQRRTHGHR